MSYLKQTPKTYNECFYPQLREARSFLNALDNALQKSGAEARRQCQIIGWNEDTKQFLLAALECHDREARINISWE